MRSILRELVVDESILDKVLDKTFKIKPAMLVTDHTKLSDVFLSQLNLECLKVYFLKGSWGTVQKLIESKQAHCTCSICSKFCVDKCIECDDSR